MRIELNAGGLCGMASISSMQSDINSLLSKSNSLMASFQRVKNFAYNMNGGVGNLGNAVNQIESRISFEESRITALQEVDKKSNGFIELAIATDINVGGLVNKNKNEFYNVNEWAKPPQNSNDKNLIERGIEWLSSAGKAISDTIGKIKDSIYGFCKSIKEKMDELMSEFKNWWKDYMTVTPIEINDEVFNNDRYVWDTNNNNDFYGGRQHGPKNEVNQDGVISSKTERLYVDIIKRNTGVEMSEAELYKYLSELNSNGCGYTAMVNTILEYYCHRINGDEEFMKKFGFPLHDENGNLNYNCLTIDIYSKTNGLTHNSSSEDSRKIILESYMGDSGIDGNSSVKVTVNKRVNITSKNVDNYLREGKQIIIRGQNLHIYTDESKSKYADCGGAGHAMVVTGVTKDGLLIVSTWGKKGYIDPKDNGCKVSWTDDNGNKQSGKIDMSFSTVEFE